MMNIHPDFKELLELLNRHKVEYLVAGAYALAFHGFPRFTGDLDILVHANHENAGRILQALEEFGFGSLGLTKEDFIQPEKVVQLGVPPVRIDVLTSLTGVTWHEAHIDRQAGKYGDVLVYYLGRTSFLANKRALGRHKDLADMEALGEQ